MARVVVVGGGLCGLAAAALLDARNVDYSLIEVKRRVGGSLISTAQDGFIFDGIRSVCDSDLPAHPLMAAWGLQDALTSGAGGVIFRWGVQTLVDALSARINGPRLMRMALSSIGELEGGTLALCLENGLMLNARAIILALPARYAERVFYGYRSEITEHLLSYQYDSRLLISLGYHYPPDAAELSIPNGMDRMQRYTHDERGGTIVHLSTHDELLNESPHQPLYSSWTLPLWDSVFSDRGDEAASVTVHAPDYPAWRESLMRMLPPRVALINSDFVPVHPAQGIAPLSQCLTQAQEAVDSILRQI